MKYLKMLGLAAVAAMALAAFGVSSASATTLCENNQTTGCTKHVANGTSLTFSAEGSTSLTGPFGEVIATCTASTVTGDTTSTGGASAVAVTGNITTLTFTGCGTRTVTANSATTGTLSIEHITGSDNGTVRSNDTTVTITNVPLLGTCRFLTNNTDIGTLTGKLPANPTFDIAASIPSENGCPTGTWEGSYEYTGTTPFAPSTN